VKGYSRGFEGVDGIQETAEGIEAIYYADVCFLQVGLDEGLLMSGATIRHKYVRIVGGGESGEACALYMGKTVSVICWITSLGSCPVR